MFDVPSSSKIRTWTLAEEAAEAAAAAACAAAAAASFALLDDPPLGIVGNLGGIADSSNANLSRHVSQAKSLALPESTMDQSLTLYMEKYGISGQIIARYLHQMNYNFGMKLPPLARFLYSSTRN